MRPGIAFDGMVPIGDMVALAREAEAAGVPGLWMAEHIGYRDGLSSAMACLAATRTLRVGQTAISVYTRHPMITAMTAATLEELAPGRTILTLATGNPRAHGREMGLPLERPLAITREYLHVVRDLLRGHPVTFKGEFFRLEDARLHVPLPRAVPLYIAAIGPRMLELAGELADGVVLSAGLSPESIGRCLEAVARGARKAGRDPRSVTSVGILLVAVARDGDDARGRAREFLAYALRNRFIAEHMAREGVAGEHTVAADAAARADWVTAGRLVSAEAVSRCAIAGTPEECRAQLGAFAASGIDVPVLLGVGDHDARRRMVDLASRA